MTLLVVAISVTINVGALSVVCSILNSSIVSAINRLTDVVEQNRCRP